MNDMDLYRLPTNSFQDTITELKALAGDDFDIWKSVEEVYHYDRENTTLKQLGDMKEELKARQHEVAFNIVRYIYLFWDRMFDWSPDAVDAAKHYIYGFEDVDSIENLTVHLVSTKKYPAFHWDWEQATWRVEDCDKDVFGLPLKGKEPFLRCHVVRWVRDHDDEWDFLIPLKFLDPDYKFKADEEFMDNLDKAKYNGIYNVLFEEIDNLGCRREIVKALPADIIRRILEINGRSLENRS